MLQEVLDSIVMLIPVFILLTLVFAAGFAIGRITRPEQK